jgi:hypothetical protein
MGCYSPGIGTLAPGSPSSCPVRWAPPGVAPSRQSILVCCLVPMSFSGLVARHPEDPLWISGLRASRLRAVGLSLVMGT